MLLLYLRELNFHLLKVLEGVVKGRTAQGILETLPHFSWHTKTLKPVSGIVDNQCFIPETKVRDFADTIQVSAKSAGERNIFSVHVKQSPRQS